MVAFASLSLFACDNQQTPLSTNTVLTESVIDDQHNAQNSLDYEGTYEGILPAASGNMSVILTLGSDTYIQVISYEQDNYEETFTKTGTYQWNNQGNIITLAGITEAPNQYFVGENVLIQLDLDGNMITGDLADTYRLDKQ